MTAETDRQRMVALIGEATNNLDTVSSARLEFVEVPASDPVAPAPSPLVTAIHLEQSLMIVFQVFILLAIASRRR